MVLDDLDAASVDADVVVAGLGLRPELAHGGAVDRDAALEHQLLGRAPRRDAGLREDFLEALHRHTELGHGQITKTTQLVRRVRSSCRSLTSTVFTS